MTCDQRRPSDTALGGGALTLGNLKNSRGIQVAAAQTSWGGTLLNKVSEEDVWHIAVGAAHLYAKLMMSTTQCSNLCLDPSLTLIANKQLVWRSAGCHPLQITPQGMHQAQQETFCRLIQGCRGNRS